MANTPEYERQAHELAVALIAVEADHNNTLSQLHAAEARVQALQAEVDKAVEVIELAQRWLTNCVPVVDLDRPKPLPVIVGFLASRPKQTKP